MKLPFISKLGALTGVFSRLNPMALLKRKKGDGDEDDHSTSVLMDEEEDLFADLGDLDARDKEIKAAAEDAATEESTGSKNAEDDDNFAEEDDDDDEPVPQLDEDALSDQQALADLEAMPDFDESPTDPDDPAGFDDGFGDDYDDDHDDDDDEDEDAVREKRKKLAVYGGGGLAAAIVLGGISWMIFGGSPAEDVADAALKDANVFNLDELAPIKKPTSPTSPTSTALTPPHAPAAATKAASSTASSTPSASQNAEAGTLSGGNLIASSGLGSELADLGLDKVQQPGMGIVVPSTTAASYAGLPAWPPAPALEIAPLSNLVKQTDIGPLPMVAEDGYSSFKAYVRPAPEGDAGEPRIAIVVTGLGISRAATEAAIASLPSDVTFSLDIYARGLDFWVKKMRATGHEVLIEMPSESAQFPFDDPGPAALRAFMPLDENIQKLEYILSRTAGYYGVLAVYGGKFLKDEEQVTGIMAELKRRGLMYVDGGAEGSLGTRMAYKQKTHWATVELNIDEVVGQAPLLRQLKELEALALKRSMTIARITATPLSLRLLSNWLKSLPAKKMRLVPVSALADKQLIR